MCTVTQTTQSLKLKKIRAKLANLESIMESETIPADLAVQVGDNYDAMSVIVDGLEGTEGEDDVFDVILWPLTNGALSMSKEKPSKTSKKYKVK